MDALVGAVDLVDDDNDAVAELQRLAEHEARLRHGALGGVDEQDDTVDHLQDTLDLAAEVGVARGVDDVDLRVAVAHGGILGQDRDAALALQIVGVHDAVDDLLIFAVDAALLEHLVDQGGLAVVNVGDDGDVSQFLHFAHFLNANTYFKIIFVCTKLYFSMENLILQQFFVFTFPERHDKMCPYPYFSFLRGHMMDSNFFALISRMRYIARWGLMRNALPENIQEHSHMVAVLAHALGVIRRDIFHEPCDVNALATAALYHDASEILTGDLPTPIKYHNAEIMSAYHAVEDLAVQKLLGMLPPELRATYADVLAEDKNGDIYHIVKAADKLSAHIKCIEERKAGNNEFLSAEAQTRAALDASPLPEVQYFLEHFIPAFERDLDELGAIGQ